MNFIGSENRKRARLIDDLLAETNRCLDFPSMQQQIPPASIEWLRKWISKMYVPNVKHNIVSVPKDKLRDVALLALRPDDTLLLGEGFNTFSRLQANRAAKTFKSLKVSGHTRQELQRVIAASQSQLRVADNPRALGVTTGNVVRIAEPDNSAFGKDRSRLVFGRPLLGIIMREGDKSLPIHSGATLVHELDHWRQREMRPVRPGALNRLLDVKLEDELMAYCRGSMFEHGLYSSDDPLYSKNSSVYNDAYIEDIRAKNEINPNEPFKPSGTIKKALADVELDTIYNILEAKSDN